jgi:hypothetical protein
MTKKKLDEVVQKKFDTNLNHFLKEIKDIKEPTKISQIALKHNIILIDNFIYKKGQRIPYLKLRSGKVEVVDTKQKSILDY